MQTAIALLIVAFAAAVAIRSIVRFVRKPDDHACSPDKCASCPMASKGCMPGRPKQ